MWKNMRRFLISILFLTALSYGQINKTGIIPAKRLLLPAGQYKTSNGTIPSYGIKVPFAKLVSMGSNPLFAHSVAWKTRQASTATNNKLRDEPTVQDVEVTQFHSQDNDGQVIFGFNAPDQARFETRNADGSVHGTYSYVDPYGQIVKRQYWDTGAGFHVTSNSYPYNSGNNSPQEQQQENQSLQQQQTHQQYFQSQEFTPEVQVPRDLHYQLYQQALASVLPKKEKQNNDKYSEINVPEIEQTGTGTGVKNYTIDVSGNFSDSKIIDNKTAAAATSEHDESFWHYNDDRSDEIKDDTLTLPQDHNGTIIIQNPEFLRISWTTDNNKNRRRIGKRLNLNDLIIKRALHVNKYNGHYTNAKRNSHIVN